MSYKFVKITTFYPAYQNDYYSRNPETEHLSYDEQLKAMMADGFGLADFFEINLRKLGVEAYSIVANDDPLQNAWAREHEVRKSGKDLLIDQLKHIMPDVVLIENAAVHHGDFIYQIKQEVPSIKQVIGWHCSPFTKDHLEGFRSFDYMITCSPGFLTKFKSYGLHTYHINYAFEHTLIPKIQSANKYPEIDFVFFGSLVAGDRYHNMRKGILDQLLEKNVEVNIHCAVTMNSLYRLLAKQGAYVVGRFLRFCGLERAALKFPGINAALQWRSFPKDNRPPKRIQKALRPPLFGVEMLKALSKAKIGFNNHIDAAGSYAANMRLFEVTGVGTCLLTDHKVNIHEFFEPDMEIVTYKSAEECLEKAIWLLNYPKEREEIAKAGQLRVLKQHTFAHRAEELDTIIRREMK